MNSYYSIIAYWFFEALMVLFVSFDEWSCCRFIYHVFRKFLRCFKHEISTWKEETFSISPEIFPTICGVDATELLYLSEQMGVLHDTKHFYHVKQCDKDAMMQRLMKLSETEKTLLRRGWRFTFLWYLSIQNLPWEYIIRPCPIDVRLASCRTNLVENRAWYHFALSSWNNTS